MRQLFLDKGNLVVKEVAQPLLDDYSLLVGVKYAYISAETEVAHIDVQDNLFGNVPHKVKRVLRAVAHQTSEQHVFDKFAGGKLGYSCAGHVIAIGKKVTRFAPGDLVACVDPGYTHFADLVCVPENFAVRVSRSEHLKATSLITIAAIALQGIRRANLQIGERVCVFGLNLLGQLTVQLAKLSGCYVYATSNVPSRLELAKEFGADEVFNVGHQDVVKEINVLTQQHGVDTTIITTSSDSDRIIDNSVAITRKRGKIVLVGHVSLNIKRDVFYAKEIDIVGSTAYGPGSYESVYEQGTHEYPYAYVRWTENRNMQECLHLIETNKLKVDSLITNEISIDKLKSTYTNIKQKELLGAVLAYGADFDQAVLRDKRASTDKKEIKFIPATNDTLQVGVIGAGDFAQKTLLPLVAKMRNARLNTIVDVNIHNALRIAGRYDAKKAFAHEEELLQDTAVDVVIISSSHKLHCEQAIKALEHGKAVFLEPPMVTDFAELQQLFSFLRKNPLVPFCVDYNRAFSPFVQKIKKVVTSRSTPLMIHYRVNAGSLGKGNATIGAGRIIGDACQIIDLFCYLTDSQPVSVSVEAMHAARDDIFPTDNFSVHITFQDGSVCSLLHNAIGHPDIGAERMEIFYDQKSILMEDYLELYGFGLFSWFNETVTTPDKGYQHLLQQFFGELKKETFTPPIAIERLYTVAKLTLLIDQLACEGGGKKGVEL